MLVFATSCKKNLDIPPPEASIISETVFENDETAIAVLTDIYSAMSVNTFTGSNSISQLTGLSSDEFALESSFSQLIDYHRNQLRAIGISPAGSDFWGPLFNYIFRCNSAIEGLNKSNSLTARVKNQLLGEAYFLRAFFNFYLVNLFGDIPLVTTSDYKINSLLHRADKVEVYQTIVSDLKKAEELLHINYLDQTLVPYSSVIERVRPNKWTAKALLARVYLFTSNYSNAESYSTEVINNGSYFSLTPSVNNVFLKNCTEAIWQLQPTVPYYNTVDARIFIIPSAGPSNSYPVYLSDQLLNSFEPSDHRAIPGNWIDSTIYKLTSTTYDTVYFPYKYKINLPNTMITSPGQLSEYLMVLRLSEQYLIRAEARARQNKLTEAINDLDVVRQRAGLPLISVTNPSIGQAMLIDKIIHEKQVELFTELGARWFDLKRAGKVDEVMTLHTPQKSNGLTSWQPYQALYPLPLAELQKAPNLVQNPGY